MSRPYHIAGTNSADKPFKTPTACLNYIAETYNLSTYTATVNLADGVYDTKSLISLPMYTATSGRVVIKGSSRERTILQARVELTHPVSYYLYTLTIKAPIVNDDIYYYFAEISCSAGTLELGGLTVDMSNVDNSYSDSLYCLRSEISGQIRVYANNVEELAGIEINLANKQNFSNIISAVEGGNFTQTADILVTENATVENFIGVTNLGVFSCATSGLTYPGRAPVITAAGTITGHRYTVNNNGIIYTSGGGPEFFPGTEAGNASRGGQYN